MVPLQKLHDKNLICIVLFCNLRDQAAEGATGSNCAAVA
jgi:hypothetical protein